MRRVVDILVERAVVDPRVNDDRNDQYPQTRETIERTKSLALAFLSSAFGGPLPYGGRPLADIHQPMAISTVELDAFLRHFADAMTECGLTSPIKSQIMAAVSTVRPAILLDDF